MLSATLAVRIDEIARDRTSGAAELAARAIDVLALARPEELEAAARALMRAQPAMAALYNVAQAALAGRLAEFAERLRQSGEIVARAAARVLSGQVVLTLSYSSTVVRALQEGGPARVICAESLPGGEGRKTAAELNATVIPDAAVYSAMSAVSVVVIGADAVTPDAVINKIGTSLVALAARERRIPAWVLCGSEKLVPACWNAELGDLFEATPRAWFAGVIGDWG